MSIQWTPDLSVGYELVDRQHQELFRRVDCLVGAIRGAKGREAVDTTLRFLERYVVEHFGTEQLLMQIHRYPHQTAHQAQHESFLETFRGLKKECDEQGPTEAIAIRLQDTLCGWLREHMGKTDTALGAFLAVQRPLASAGAPRPAPVSTR